MVQPSICSHGPLEKASSRKKPVREMQQRDALVALYEATIGTAWRNSTGWLGPAAPCSPGGVPHTCTRACAHTYGMCISTHMQTHA